MSDMRRRCEAPACGQPLTYGTNWPTGPYWFPVHLHVLFFVSSGILLLSPACPPRLALRRRAAADITAGFSISIDIGKLRSAIFQLKELECAAKAPGPDFQAASTKLQLPWAKSTYAWGCWHKGGILPAPSRGARARGAGVGFNRRFQVSAARPRPQTCGPFNSKNASKRSKARQTHGCTDF